MADLAVFHAVFVLQEFHRGVNGIFHAIADILDCVAEGHTAELCTERSDSFELGAERDIKVNLVVFERELDRLVLATGCHHREGILDTELVFKHLGKFLRVAGTVYLEVELRESSVLDGHAAAGLERNDQRSEGFFCFFHVLVLLLMKIYELGNLIAFLGSNET